MCFLLKNFPKLQANPGSAGMRMDKVPLFFKTLAHSLIAR
jgi:hypothetical protein